MDPSFGQQTTGNQSTGGGHMSSSPSLMGIMHHNTISSGHMSQMQQHNYYMPNQSVWVFGLWRWQLITCSSNIYYIINNNHRDVCKLSKLNHLVFPCAELQAHVSHPRDFMPFLEARRIRCLSAFCSSVYWFPCEFGFVLLIAEVLLFLLSILRVLSFLITFVLFLYLLGCCPILILVC